MTESARSRKKKLGADGMPPIHLYKYRSLTGENFRFTQAILLRKEVYFSSISKFNDPFEGHFKMVMPPQAPLAQRQYEPWANQLENARVQREASVLSLTEVKDDVLMWAHYADHHRGICIEFSTAVPETIFSKARKVRYLTHFKEIVHGATRGPDDLMEFVCTAKAKHWEYEKEWRIVEHGPGCRTFPPECITGVILGCRISEDNKRWISDWVDQRMVSLYQARQVDDAFALEIAPL